MSVLWAYSGSDDMVVSCKMSALPVELIKSVIAEFDDKSSFIDGNKPYQMVFESFLMNLLYRQVQM